MLSLIAETTCIDNLSVPVPYNKASSLLGCVYIHDLWEVTVHELLLHGMLEIGCSFELGVLNTRLSPLARYLYKLF